MSIVTPEEMRAIDAASPVPVDELVRRAGLAVGRAAVEMLGGSYGRTVAVIAGPGNNGADGRVAGEWLRRRGVSVKVFDAARYSSWYFFRNYDVSPDGQRFLMVKDGPAPQLIVVKRFFEALKARLPAGRQAVGR